MFCTWCGAQIPDSTKFCTNCGKPVTIVKPAAEKPAAEKPAAEKPAAANPAKPAVAPVPEEKAAAPVRKLRKPSAGKVIFSVLICLLIFALGLAASVLFSARRALSAETLEEVVDELDFTKMTVRGEDGDAVTLTELAEERMGPLLEKVDVKPETIVGILNKGYVKDFLVENLTSYSDYFLEGKKLRPLSVDSLIEFFEDNNNRLTRDSKGLVYYTGTEKPESPGLYISEDDVFDLFDKLGNESLNTSAIRKLIGVEPQLIMTGFSSVTVLIIVLIAGLLALLVLLLHLRTIWSGFGFLGWTAFLIGGVLIAARFIGKARIARLGYSALGDFSAPMFDMFLKLGIILAAAGLVLAIPLSLIARAIAKNRLRKAA